jgi:predicted AlkP superfamily phosphohydrolase/phosphomutase
MNKLLMLGWDGATWTLLRPWIDAGLLPNLARLIARGASGPLTTTIPPVSASAWISFATGCNPGQHGVFDFVFPRPGSYDVGVTNVTLRAMPPFWNVIERAGGQVGLVSIPITEPPQPVQGFVVCGFLVPSPDYEYTYPKALKQEILAKVGEWPVHEAEEHRTVDNARFCRDMLHFDAQRTEHVLYLMRNKPWDFLGFVMKSTDTLQHEIFQYLDPTHPRYNAAEAARVMPAIREFYAGLDACVGRLVEAAGPDATVVLMSDHGFGPFHKFFHTNNWLHRLGLLQFKRGPLNLGKRAIFRAGATPVNVMKLSKVLNLNQLRKRVKRGRGRGLLRRAFLSFDDVDWTRTQAFSIGNFGQIYLNVKGRRPQGIVAPGADYEALRERIIRAALDLRDPDGGDRVIAAAYRREEIYHGARLDNAPDIVLHTDRAKYVSFGHADFGSNRVIEPSVGQTGHHAMDGIVVLAGPGIAPGGTLTGANIVDVAPSILYAMGLPVPADMDGKPLLGAYDPAYVAAHPLRTGAGQGESSGDYTAQDEEQVMERLRDLGYVQ